MGQDIQMQMVGCNGGNQFRQHAGKNVRNLNGYNDIQNVGNQFIQNAVHNLNRTGNLVAARAEGNATGHNDLDEIEKVNANCILMANPQQASTSGTQTDKAPVYDSDGLAELLVEKSIVSSLLEEKKKLKSDFKIHEDELLDKKTQLEKKIEELDNILVKMGQSIQTIHMLSPKPDPFYHTEQKMALGYQNPFYLKQAQQKQHN
nr:hypothetical protein [Tanacetum cinerariifolium]